MRRVALLLVLLGVSLFSCDASFRSCLKKTNDLGVVQNDTTLSIPVSSDKLLGFGPKPPKNSVVYDPFLRLWIVKTNKRVRYPFKINQTLPAKELASIKQGIVCGSIIEEQNGLEHFGRFSKPAKTPAIVLNGCCELVGINTSRGVIQKRYIEHFLQKGSVYASAGVRIRQCKKHIVVASVNPFVKTPLKRLDRIVAVDGKKIRTQKEFNEAVLFSAPNSEHTFKVIRCGKEKELTCTLSQRKGGGFLSDTFLETLGVYLNEKLVVIDSTYPVLRRNDRIFMVNGTKVGSFEDVRRSLSDTLHEALIGINRNGLDIFVKIKSKN